MPLYLQNRGSKGHKLEYTLIFLQKIQQKTIDSTMASDIQHIDSINEQAPFKTIDVGNVATAENAA